MENSQALSYYYNMSQESALNQYSVKNIRWNDFSTYDSNFILNYAGKNSCILDLGSGTGLIVNKVHPSVQSITAVDIYPEFTNFIDKVDNVEVINEDILKYVPEKKYDLITFMGVLNFFNDHEVREIYKRYQPYVKKNGHIIVKNQFGVTDDVIVSGYSEELGKDYFSHYRHIQKEVSIISSQGYEKVKIFDIYPKECNRWENTHFYAIVASV